MDACAESNRDGRLLITVSGDVDLSNAGKLLLRLMALARPATGEVLLDLSQVTFMDCAGLRALKTMERYVLVSGGSPLICALSPAVGRLFELGSALGISPLVRRMNVPIPGRVAAPRREYGHPRELVGSVAAL